VKIAALAACGFSPASTNGNEVVTFSVQARREEGTAFQWSKIIAADAESPRRLD
jgi:hypothetical protein